MIQKINEKVDVITIYKHAGGQVTPYKIRWNRRDYLITKIGYHHKVRQGRTVYHLFHVCSDTLAFRLKHDPDTLHWILEEVSDGNPD
jgi:hypothetical protein